VKREPITTTVHFEKPKEEERVEIQSPVEISKPEPIVQEPIEHVQSSPETPISPSNDSNSERNSEKTISSEIDPDMVARHKREVLRCNFSSSLFSSEKRNQSC
jgi:hypothetical protein